MARNFFESRTVRPEVHRDRRGSDGFVGLPADLPGAVWHRFVIDVKDLVHLRFEAKGGGTAIHYDPPLHCHPAPIAARASVHLVTERMCNGIRSVPVPRDVISGREDDVTEAIIEAVRR